MGGRADAGLNGGLERSIYTRTMPETRRADLPRRALLSSAATGGLGLLLAACSVPGAAPPSTPNAAATKSASRVSAMTPAKGGVAGGTTVTVVGSGLTALRSVRVAGTTLALDSRSATQITFRTPPAPDFATGAAPVELLNSTGTVVHTASFAYEVSSGLDRQLAYVLAYWKHYNPDYQVVVDNDCVDFTSQALLRRGWTQQGEWTLDASNVYHSGAAWVSSTAFRSFLLDHPSLGTPLTDSQRAKVKIGDVVQFNWTGKADGETGDRDHTGTVTAVEHTSTGVKVKFAGHTNDSDYRDVDTAITKDHPGGVAYYWSLA